jgi:DNA gyrase subunit A
MRLSRLTALERSKIEGEYLELLKLIEQLRSILANPKKILAIIRTRTRAARKVR